jgi:prolyl-tRNA synthetase
MPVLQGVKTANERFAGAEETYCIEALMQDGKALQAGTSHFLGQNFAKAFDVKYATREGGLEYVWATSWGVSTRLIGALIMAHSDDNGLVLPPKLAPIHVVIVPIYKGQEQLDEISVYAKGLKQTLERHGLSVKFDNRDTHKPGFKFAEYELKGVPVRIAIGPKDMESNTLEIVRRDTLEKMNIDQSEAENEVLRLLDEIQNNIYQKALEHRNRNTQTVDSYDGFKAIIDGEGGFISAHWDGTSETEELIKQETKATIRCIPLNNVQEPGVCIRSGKPSNQRVIFAKAY